MAAILVGPTPVVNGNGIRRPTFYVPIGGTRAWNDRGAPKRRWWQSESEFAMKMASLNCMMLDAEQPFVWTTDLGGVQFWRRWQIWFGKVAKTSDHRDWVAAGENLVRYIDSIRCPIPYEDRNIITHSHGFQVWAYAAAFGLKTRRLVAIAPPFRRDMEDIVRVARQNVELWVLVADKDADRIADWGAFGDGVFRRCRTFDVDGCRPDQTISIPQLGHSGLVSNRIDLWETEYLAEFLR